MRFSTIGSSGNVKYLNKTFKRKLKLTQNKILVMREKNQEKILEHYAIQELVTLKLGKKCHSKN